VSILEVEHLILGAAVLARMRLQGIVKLQVLAPAREIKAIKFGFIQGSDQAYEATFVLLCRQ
jgi:hypothetical protein